MNLTRTWFGGILLGGVALGAMCGSLEAQNWQPNWQPADSGTAPVDWQQRVLKQTQPPQASIGQRPANAYQQPVSPYRTAQRPSSDFNRSAAAAGSAEPGATGRQRTTRVTGGEEIVEPGTVQFDPLATDGVFAGGGCANCGGPGGECGASGACGVPACDDSCDFGWECFDGRCGPWLRGLSVFVGADSFKGPLDNGRNGNFGLNEGLNLARPLGDPWGCGYQIGANFVQSNFSGAPVMSVNDRFIRAPFRKQYFATAGIFQRAQCYGFQWGVAYDYLHDIYYGNANMQQIRSETSYVLDDIYTVGYYGAYGVATDQDRVIDGKLDPTDMFVFYVKRNFENGGDGRLWLGASGNGDGLLGADLWVPLGRGFALENRINYLIPKQGTGDTAQVRESWGLVIQLVWYPGQNARCQQQNPYRPMFNVADNSLFMVDRLATQ